MREKKTPPFRTEAEMCAAFIAALPAGWTAYAETGGFDILLVRGADGFQIGVEAKLRLNAEVLTQVLEADGWEYRDHGPDCRAVLVPDGYGGGFNTIASHLAITVIRMNPTNRGYVYRFDPRLPEPSGGDSFLIEYHNKSWHELCPLLRLDLPEYIPDVAAGSSAPVQLTPWKIAALKIAVILETRGFVTRADFKALNIDPRRWIDGHWLIAGDAGLVRGPNCPDFAGQHPTVVEQIRDDFPEWAPRHAATPVGKVPVQPLLFGEAAA